MNKIVTGLLFLSLMGIINLDARPAEYQNQVRRHDSRFKSSFRIDKDSPYSVQMLDGFNLSLVDGVVASGTGDRLNFGAIAGPNLLGNLASGAFYLQFQDAETSSVSYRLRLPDNYIVEGNILVLASGTSDSSTTSTKLSATIFVNGIENTLSNVEVNGGADETVSIDYTGLTSLAPGDDIVLEIGRHDELSGTGSLEIKNIYFRYNESIPFSQ